VRDLLRVVAAAGGRAGGDDAEDGAVLQAGSEEDEDEDADEDADEEEEEEGEQEEGEEGAQAAAGAPGDADIAQVPPHPHTPSLNWAAAVEPASAQDATSIAPGHGRDGQLGPCCLLPCCRLRFSALAACQCPATSGPPRHPAGGAVGQ